MGHQALLVRLPLSHPAFGCLQNLQEVILQERLGQAEDAVQVVDRHGAVAAVVQIRASPGAGAPGAKAFKSTFKWAVNGGRGVTW